MLAAACFFGGFMIAQSIHEQKKSPPIIIHAGHSVDPTKLPLHYNTASKMDISEEILDFETNHESGEVRGSKNDSKSTVDSLSQRATDKRKGLEGGGGHDEGAIQKKIEGFESAARNEFHALVGIPIQKKDDDNQGAKKNVSGDTKNAQHHTERKAEQKVSDSHDKLKGEAHKKYDMAAHHPPALQKSPTSQESEHTEHQKTVSNRPVKTVPEVPEGNKSKGSDPQEQWTAENAPLDSAFYNLDFYGQNEQLSRHAMYKEREQWHTLTYADVNHFPESRHGGFEAAEMNDGAFDPSYEEDVLNEDMGTNGIPLFG